MAVANRRWEYGEIYVQIPYEIDAIDPLYAALIIDAVHTYADALMAEVLSGPPRLSADIPMQEIWVFAFPMRKEVPCGSVPNAAYRLEQSSGQC